MKQIILLIGFAALFTSTAVARQTTYTVLLSFKSSCCGVPSDEPLMKMIKKFKKQYHLKSISADHIGPMGREGEYYLGFRLKEMNKVQKAAFIKQLDKLVPLMKDRGAVSVERNYNVDSDNTGRAVVKKEKL